MAENNVPADPLEHLPGEVALRRTVYPSGAEFPSHTHRSGQFAHAAEGGMLVFTSQGNWVVPPGRAVWMPAGLPHAMRMGAAVTMVNVFVSPECAGRSGLGRDCVVVDVSPLLRCLLDEALRVPLRHDPDGRDGKVIGLLVDEIARMPALPLNAPLPDHPRLARLCRKVVDEPSMEIGIDFMASEAGMSRRTFTRLFRASTGMSFAAWRQQVCLLRAVHWLGAGRSVTDVALDLGYGSPSAFAAAFRRVLGEPPSRYGTNAMWPEPSRAKR